MYLKKIIPTFKIFTLGCKVNQYESSRLAAELAGFGFEKAPNDSEADVYIVNTCTVTAEAARKTRQAIRRFSEKHTSALVYALGCAAEIPDVALANVNGNVRFITNKGKAGLAREIAAEFGLLSFNKNFLYEAERTRALLKVQDGCDNFCSYCIIPYVRGRSTSREPEDILKELNEIEKKGFGEVVLTGIHLGDYGKNTKAGLSLAALVKYLLEGSSINRIRLSSLEPMDFSLELLKLFAANKRLCRHLHLPLQHGSDKILKLMRRNYTLLDFDKIVKAAVETVPGMTITTDVLIGFPGETEEDFNITYNYIKNTPIYRLHVFPFSSHRGTVAARLPEHLGRREKKKRAASLIALGREKQSSI